MNVSKKSVLFGVFLLFTGLVLGVGIAQSNGVNTNAGYHPLQQISVSSGNTQSVDSDGNGSVDVSDRAYRADNSNTLGGKTLNEVVGMAKTNTTCSLVIDTDNHIGSRSIKFDVPEKCSIGFCNLLLVHKKSGIGKIEGFAYYSGEKWVSAGTSGRNGDSSTGTIISLSGTSAPGASGRAVYDDYPGTDNTNSSFVITNPDYSNGDQLYVC